MTNTDIEGSKPKEWTEKYLGDRMNINDIHGSCPSKFTEKYLGDRMNISDIEGSKTKQRSARKEMHD